MHPDVTVELTAKIEMLKAGKEFLLHSICNNESDIELCKILAEANQVSIDFLENKINSDNTIAPAKRKRKSKMKGKMKNKPLTCAVVNSILNK